MKYKNLILIGSSHVSRESVNLVKRTIEDEKPGIIAIELDKDRLIALLHKKKRGLFVKGVGFKGALFAALGAWIERKIGKIVKVEPGSEMKMAISLARKNDIQLALIDQHINITLRRFSQTITWKEKWHFLVDMFLGVVAPKRQMRKMHLNPEHMYDVPSKDTIKHILSFVKRRYPNFYTVLVHERNIVMANNLASIMAHYPKKKIVAIVGAGHEDEMMELIKEKLYKHTTA